MSKVLLVEDDDSLGSSLQSYLTGEGHEVVWAQSLTMARELKGDEEIIILDWMLPDGQGVDFLKELREAEVSKPVIMLTARTDLIDKVIGLEAGANDYMTKPFEPRELIARIRVQLRDHHKKDHDSNDGIMTRGELVINQNEREIRWHDEVIEFTKMEFDFLSLLAESPNRAFSREEILNKVWGYENYPSTRTVDTHVLQIRQKLSDELIETVRGIGYRFRFNDN
ncbi:response regulator transcription factor [Halobacteriovorax sp. JY17]|uniref:response regulator transcription factor n=1 Tax=Halobacteriovorax sp. JY17 TaxID=2014617 RepID=UPI000C4686DA|nr:response regulator transcription factor [Halobacteriovorax sp. JY17]PIK15367.1 MAG: DNA-binding response regulator [Halobacteriovorax sp. JY17]